MALDPVQDKAETATLPPGVVLPYCGLHGEDDSTLWRCRRGARVRLLRPRTPTTPRPRNGRPVEGHPELVEKLTDALRSALDNLRQRTRRLEASSVFQKRWEHHPSGCGSTLWRLTDMMPRDVRYYPQS